MLVASQRVPEDFVRPTIEEDPLERMNALLGRVMSRANLLKLIELQVRIRDREDITGLGLFIYENPLAFALDLFLHLEDAFAFQHDCQNVSRRRVMRVV